MKRKVKFISQEKIATPFMARDLYRLGHPMMILGASEPHHAGHHFCCDLAKPGDETVIVYGVHNQYTLTERA